MRKPVFSVIRPSPEVLDSLASIVGDHEYLFLKQRQAIGEIISGFEYRNEYDIQTKTGENLGTVVEKNRSIKDSILMLLLRSHRPLNIDLYDKQKNKVLKLHRKFFWFFSDLFLQTPQGQHVGSIHRRFGIIYKKYDIMDQNQMVFAQIKAPIWRLWSFELFDNRKKSMGMISKRWRGILSEAFTDADTFGVLINNTQWNRLQRMIVFCAAVSIDFDFFEENQTDSGKKGFIFR